ncbi:MAG TPA: glycosyltransferase family 25 protein [Chthoniobacterales bacterium]|nr:glycosyltransferase family 25 protein [Chthoniobacterales bacterium]
MSDPCTPLTKFFPHRVCINLDRRPERWERMQARFADARVGAVERFPAVDGGGGGVPASWPYSSGAYGCLQSHLAVVREARAQERESVLIMEDDVVFADGFHKQFQERVRWLPADWDMLFFGCLHNEPPEPAAPGLSRLRISFSTFMYAIRRTVYDAFIFLNQRARYPVDKNNLFLQRRFRCYCFIPHLAWVDDSYSDAQGVPCSHWYIRDSMALGGARMKAVEKRTAAIIPYRETGNRARSVKNLRYVARWYGSLFSVFIVEQNERPHLQRQALPPGCEYAHVPGPGLELACFAALDRYAREKDYFIVSDANVVCKRMEIAASLIKCAEYDAVGSFATYLDLDDADSDLLLSGREYHTERYRVRARRGRFREYFTATTAGLRTLCTSALTGHADEPACPSLRIFDSPGSALCLSQGTRAFNETAQQTGR